MEIINFSEQDSIINQYLAEIRDKDYQKNRLLFRNNVMRIGEFEAFEISKTLNYEPKTVVTPLGTTKVNVPTDKIVLATIFRAGLPFHNKGHTTPCACGVLIGGTRGHCAYQEDLSR